MNPNNLLRKQVRTELKKRRYIFYTLTLLSVLYIVLNFIFGDTGILKLRELEQKKAELEMEVVEIKKQDENLKSAIDSYIGNDFYMEKQAREDFGLSKPEEYTFLYDR